MCGIIGVVGAPDALDILLEGLARLEYRGYDSAGVALAGSGETWRARTAEGTESVAALGHRLGALR
ncbi:MAG: glutamine--fructose-6-phosphate aminotransferase, partial [Acidimicrobiaceae bacterium]|nr:glutamine--fructose-6-phosphate aminotransferase [Acidimicrobiaceae bacterium]